MNKEVILQASRNLKEGIPTELVMIAATGGSSPGKEGNAMLVTAQGQQCGTIGGGPLEFQVGNRCRDYIQKHGKGFNELKTYYLHPNEAEDLGAVCGGEDTLLFLNLDIESYDMIKAFCKASEYIEQDLAFGIEISNEKDHLDDYHIRLILPTSDTRFDRMQHLEIHDNGVFKIYTPEEGKIRVIVYGGGHVSKALVPVLENLDFACTVVDDSDVYANRENFPTATEIVNIDFDKAGEALDIGKNDFVVIVTRGHRMDYVCEKDSLERKPSYIGCIGSKKKTEFVRRRLLNDGFTKEELDQVYAPIGISIDAKTPNEIAISIAAQLIQKRYELSH